jgi:hypothetical protein
MGRGSALPGSGDGESNRSQISLPSHLKYTKMAKNGRFHTLFAYKLPKMLFSLKST